jgi:hypothetical protein
VYEASKVELVVRMKKDKGQRGLELPSAGFQKVRLSPTPELEPWPQPSRFLLPMPEPLCRGCTRPRPCHHLTPSFWCHRLSQVVRTDGKTSAESKAEELHVTIDLQNPRRATSAELADPEYLAPSAMVDSSDEVGHP